jgi:hypothetical protein
MEQQPAASEIAISGDFAILAFLAEDPAEIAQDPFLIGVAEGLISEDEHAVLIKQRPER